MARLLQANRASKRLSYVVRTWLALRSQRRRRRQASPATPPVPVITDGTYWWEASEPGMFDTSIVWTIDYGSFPVASVEVFVRVNGGEEQSLGTAPSSDGAFSHPRASAGGETLSYRARYVFDDVGGQVVGAFSNVFVINVPAEGG